MTNPLFELQDFSVAYGAVEAVHRVALRVDEGEIVTVIGPNGAGKTTLLCAAMGLAMRSPARVRLPLDGSRPIAAHSGVVLPAPLGPMTVTISPSSTLSATWCTASTAP